MTSLRARVVVRRPEFVLDVDLTLEPGQVIAVLGPNGAGKSTLLAVLAGLLRPDQGRVELAGRLLTDIDASVHLPPHRRGVGLLAQDPLLFPHLSALANVAFGPRAHGRSRCQAREVAEHWLSTMGVNGFADRRPGQLSGGQAQQVALARALAADPELLLLDEPLAALDVDAAPAVRGLLRRVLGGGRRCAVLVTHDPLDALVLADTVLVLAAGRVVEQGATREVLARPRTAFTARIAGLDLVAGTACADGLRTPDGSVVAGHLPEPIPAGRPAVAVFAPAAVAVFRERPHGSPRNAFPAVVNGLEPHGDVVRVRVGGGPGWAAGIAADVTPAAVAELGLEPGCPVWLAVKAAEVAVHPVAGAP